MLKHQRNKRILELTGDVDLLVNVDTCENQHSHKCERESQDNKRPSPSCEIACEGENQQHHCTTDVWRHRIQIRLDCRVVKPGNNLWKKERNGLQGDTQADFNCEECECTWLSKDFKRVSEVELLVHDG